MVIFTKLLPKAQNIMYLTTARLSNFWLRSTKKPGDFRVFIF